MARPPRVHYLPKNEMERSPRHVLVFDTETTEWWQGGRRHQQLRLWCAEYRRRKMRRKPQASSETASGETGDELVDLVEGCAGREATLWVYAHHLAFDLTTSRMVELLMARGWELGEHALHADARWARMKLGERRVVLADIHSWLPRKAAELGEAVGLAKGALPDQAAPWEVWRDYCRRDVELETEAICQLMDWWDRERLGNWSLTGAATGFSAMRHMPRRHRVLVDPDPDAIAFERRALVGGRREVWRVGKLDVSRFVEIDFETAHLQLCASKPLPGKRLRAFGSLAIDDWRIVHGDSCVIAECTVRTSSARYPVEIGGNVWHPVGEFDTVLCGPELQEAARRGELIRVGRGYQYRIDGHMKPWADWALAQLADTSGSVPAIAKIAVKHWARSVPGKWAGRTSRLYRERDATELGWSIKPLRLAESGAAGVVMNIDGHEQWWVRDVDQDNCFPAVLAFIQSWTRVLLGRLVDSLGEDRVVQCNTDSCLAEVGRWEEPEWDNLAIQPLRARVKRDIRRLEIISPQHLVADDSRELAGVAKDAVLTDEGKWEWMTWPSFARQIELGMGAGYVQEPRSVDLSAVPVARWVWSDGRCTAPEAAVVAGKTVLVGGEPLRLVSGQAVDLRASQHPALLRARAAAGG